MLEQVWETFNGLFKTVHKQGRRIEDLETRITRMESRLRDREAETFGERPVLHIPEPEQVECPRCPVYHSPELPCPTPVDEAWVKFGDKEVTA